MRKFLRKSPEGAAMVAILGVMSLLALLAGCGQATPTKVADFSGGDDFASTAKTSIMDGHYSILPYGPNARDGIFTGSRKDGSWHPCYLRQYDLQVAAFGKDMNILPTSSGEKFFSWQGAIEVRPGRESEIFDESGMAVWPNLIIKVPAAATDFVIFRIYHSSDQCGKFEFLGVVDAKQLSSGSKVVQKFADWSYRWTNVAYAEGQLRGTGLSFLGRHCETCNISPAQRTLMESALRKMEE